MKEPGRYQEETEDSHKTREIPDHHTSNDRGFPYRQVQKTINASFVWRSAIPFARSP